MAIASNPLKVPKSLHAVEAQPLCSGHRTTPGGPQPARSGNAIGTDQISTRMYTEQQVADMLQISVSKLRKWRMKLNGRQPGPPFRKIGRLVRYPEWGLVAFVYGE